uniref:Bifunctional inhibitor/plant lipid transfer protein/seed storage helical domain-containing protein n=1 Tax=Hordeum vulgare subsp. vulgare TaxID=112509 RepID=A0A8I6YIP2_HORVV
MNNAKLSGVCFLVLVALSSCSCYAREVNQVDHCLLDKKKVMRDCWHNIEKSLGDRYPPLESPCCHTIKDAKDIHCVCDRFSAHELTLISLSKFATVTRACGNGLHTHSNCAGYRVPEITPPSPPASP